MNAVWCDESIVDTARTPQWNRRQGKTTIEDRLR